MKRSLASFGDVANINVINDDNRNNDDNNKINKNSNNIMDVIKPQKSEKKLIGIYFDPEVAEKIRRVAGGQKGAQSRLVNEVMKRFFQSENM